MKRLYHKWFWLAFRKTEYAVGRGVDIHKGVYMNRNSRYLREKVGEDRNMDSGRNMWILGKDLKAFRLH